MAGCVLLYWPNVVDYFRMCLVLAAWCSRDAPAVFIPLYLAFVVLDVLTVIPTFTIYHMMAVVFNPRYRSLSVDAYTSIDYSHHVSAPSVHDDQRSRDLTRQQQQQHEEEEEDQNVDGWLARRLGQTSRFGAWLDVVVDNVGRGMLWSLLSEWGWLVSSLEWCVFVCNHSRGAEEWKSSFSTSPRLIQAIMADGFNSPLGVWVVGGLHYLPLCVYGHQTGAWTRWLGLSTWSQAVGILVLAAGRLLALCAEIWCVWTHMDQLIRNQPVEKQS